MFPLLLKKKRLIYASLNNNNNNTNGNKEKRADCHQCEWMTELDKLISHRFDSIRFVFQSIYYIYIIWTLKKKRQVEKYGNNFRQSIFMLRYFKKHMIVRLIRKCVSCLLWKKIGIIIICSYIYTIIIFNIFGKLDENYIFHISSVFVVFIDFRLIIFLGFSPLYKYIFQNCRQKNLISYYYIIIWLKLKLKSKLKWVDFQLIFWVFLRVQTNIKYSFIFLLN